MSRLSSSPSFIMPTLLCMLFIPLSITSSSSDNSEKCQKGQEEAAAAVALYIFGDSFFDSGNNNYINTTTLDQANFWPYGESYFDFPTGRFSDGRLVSDFIAEYAKLELIGPFLQPGRSKQQHEKGANFASAGAGALVETFQGAVINLSTQLRYYKKVVGWLTQKWGNAEAKNTLSRAVYLFSFGTNDYISPFLTNSTILSSYSKSEYVGMVIGNLTIAIKEIYKSGGRKFGILNLGPLGCLPGLRIIKPESNGGCLEEASELAELHNEALSKLLSELGSQLEGFNYAVYDFHSNLRQRINQPSKYGFKAGETACCGAGRFRGVFSCGGKRSVKEFQLCEQPSEYVFWDSVHLTEKVYKQMADQMWEGSSHHVMPYNLKNLFQCL